MNVKVEAICRLCLNVAENGFEIINDITRKRLEYILLRVNLDVSKDPIMCRECAEVTEKCFHFKSVCNDKKGLLFASDKNGVMFESKNTYKDDKDLEAVDNSLICQFCSNYIDGTNSIFLDTLMNDVSFAEMLQVLMPEVDFNIKNSSICTSCRQDLDCYIKFVDNCMVVEEKITTYVQNGGTLSSTQVDLREVMHYLFKNIPELDNKISTIKQEYALEDEGETHYEVVCDDITIKSEEALDIKDEEYNFNETVSSQTEIGNVYQIKYNDIHMKQNTGGLKSRILIHRNITGVEMYECSTCTHKTKHKSNLAKHMLIHKDITEVKMYKCTICIYETKFKRCLVRHMLIHKDTTEVEKIHKCSMCPYQTKERWNLKRHTIVHKDITEVETYKCLSCTYRTKHKGYLKFHMLKHKDITEVETYKCSICTYKTKYKRSLKKHMSVQCFPKVSKLQK